MYYYSSSSLSFTRGNKMGIVSHHHDHQNLLFIFLLLTITIIFTSTTIFQQQQQQQSYFYVNAGFDAWPSGSAFDSNPRVPSTQQSKLPASWCNFASKEFDAWYDLSSSAAQRLTWEVFPSWTDVSFETQFLDQCNYVDPGTWDSTPVSRIVKSQVQDNNNNNNRKVIKYFCIDEQKI